MNLPRLIYSMALTALIYGCRTRYAFFGPNHGALTQRAGPELRIALYGNDILPAAAFVKDLEGLSEQGEARIRPGEIFTCDHADTRCLQTNEPAKGWAKRMGADYLIHITRPDTHLKADCEGRRDPMNWARFIDDLKYALRYHNGCHQPVSFTAHVKLSLYVHDLLNLKTLERTQTLRLTDTTREGLMAQVEQRQRRATGALLRDLMFPRQITQAPRALGAPDMGPRGVEGVALYRGGRLWAWGRVEDGAWTPFTPDGEIQSGDALVALEAPKLIELGLLGVSLASGERGPLFGPHMRLRHASLAGGLMLGLSADALFSEDDLLILYQGEVGWRSRARAGLEVYAALGVGEGRRRGASAGLHLAPTVGALWAPTRRTHLSLEISAPVTLEAVAARAELLPRFAPLLRLSLGSEDYFF